MVNKIKTGVPGFDDIYGGLVEGGATVLAGEPGTGKTIFGVQFLKHGARYDEPGVFVTVENNKEKLVEYIKGFGIDLKQEKNIEVIDMPVFTTDVMMLKNIEQTVERLKAKRLVFDTLKIFEYLYPEPNRRWKEILHFKKFLQKYGLTSVLCVEKSEKPLEEFTLEESVSDSLIVLSLEKEKDMMMRKLTVLKMAGESGVMKIHSMEITKKGVRVFK
jgi:circadian clock protein KaiC